MSTPFVIISVLFILGAFALMGAILLQKKRSAGGLANVAGMGSTEGTYWDKNRRRSAEGTLETWTKVCAVILGVLAVLLCII
jgi:preprotein translocase subunit SecG